MIKLENFEVMGWEHVIRGMRNPMNSWDKSDSHYCSYNGRAMNCVGCKELKDCQMDQKHYILGPNDLDLMMRLAKAGPVDGKFRRMIVVYVDITAPLYWWKEFDTYKVGTVANSCSTMHKIHAKEFALTDFSCERLVGRSLLRLQDTVKELNFWREIYLNGGEVDAFDNQISIYEPKSKEAWWQMIQLLPSSYNQRRTIMLNYEVLSNIYIHRRNHKLDEWLEFCLWIERLPYHEIITCNAA